MNIKDILNEGIRILKENNIEEAILKSRMLLMNLTGLSKEYLMVHDAEEVSDSNQKAFFYYINLLKDGKPIQYIINKQSFMGLEFYVDKNVLIPQLDTENLVEEVNLILDNSGISIYDDVKILDMCTGSGAIAISLAKFLKYKNLEIYAVDVSKEALNVAKENALRHNVKINFIEANMFDKLNTSIKFDVIVSNPPYIKSDVIETLSKEVQNEPHIALDGGEDGLDFYKILAENSYKFLKEDGYLALEIGYDQKDSVQGLLLKNGYREIYSRKDLSGNDRVVVGKNKLMRGKF